MRFPKYETGTGNQHWRQAPLSYRSFVWHDLPSSGRARQFSWDWATFVRPVTPQSKMENICQDVTFLNQRRSGILVRTIRILCWGCQMLYNCGTKDWTYSFLGQKCFSTSDSFSDGTEVRVCIFTSCLVFESLKGSVKGSIWSAGKTISIGRPHGSGFAEKNASFTIYGINKPNLLTHKIGKFMRYQIDRNMQISFASNGTKKPFFQKKLTNSP